MTAPTGPGTGTAGDHRPGPQQHDEVTYLRARVAHLQAQLADMTTIAHTDPLTGALNRLGLAEAWWSTHPGQVASLVDLDHFKRINDTHGHDAGDTVLTAVASLLTARGVVARLGGDELLLIAEREALTGWVPAWWVDLPAGPRITVTGTVGHVDVAPDLGETLHRADLAMYRAKQTGRGTTAWWDPTVDVPGAGGPGRRRVRDVHRPGLLTVPVAPCCGALLGDEHDRAVHGRGAA